RAADAQHPWATIAARDAVTRLWPVATTEERRATRSALQASDEGMLQQIDVGALATERPSMVVAPISIDSAANVAGDGGRARALILLFCTSIGLLGLWSRERVMRRTTANG
ncbi:MAG: hypothetical protein ACI85K_001240, partial [Hyphomicrobiaceae bacterium]